MEVPNTSINCGLTLKVNVLFALVTVVRYI